MPDAAVAPPPKPPTLENGVKYEVEVRTADELGAGTDANVYLSIHGEKGEQSRIVLQTNKSGKNKFEKGSVDNFDLELQDVGKVRLHF